MRPLHASWVVYTLFFGVLVGVVVDLTWRIHYAAIWGLGLAIAGLVLAVWRPSLLMLSLAFVAGLTVADLRVGAELVGQEIFAQLVGETVMLTGTLTESPDLNSGMVKIRLTNLSVSQPTARSPTEDEHNQTEPVTVVGTIYVQLAGSVPDLQRSDRVTVQGKIGTGFGVFAASMFRPELLAVQRDESGDVFESMRRWFAALVRNHIPSPEVDLGLGYLMGMSEGIPESFAAALRAVGMTHIIVASGTHLGILVEAARKTLGRLSRFAGAFFSSLLIAGFVLVVGFTPSMTRAALVAIITLLLGYVGRQLAPWRLLSLVATITLLISPMYLFNLGWQLSFASFFGILVVGPTLNRMFYGGKSPPWLAEMLIASLATCLTCTPLLVYNFGTISLLSFVANLLILPTLPYVMLLVLLTGVTSFWPFFATLMGRLATWALDFHMAVVNFLSTKTMLIINLPAGDARIFLLYLIVGAILLMPKIARRRSKKRSKPN